MNVLQKLRRATNARAKHWNPDGNDVPVSFRFMELAGEAGEVCNAGKKLSRHELNMAGGSPDQTNLREELGDVMICCDLIAAHYGIDLWEAVVEKFNKTSDKQKFPVKMNKDGSLVNPEPYVGLTRTITQKAVVVDREGKVIGMQG
jgi:NTP pyrophosphatase (non-canonical NTP hydrolase)